MVGIALLAIACIPSAHSQTATGTQLDRDYADSVTPLLKKYCVECHSNENAEAELNLEAFRSLKEIRHNTKVWLKVAEDARDRRDAAEEDERSPRPRSGKQIRGWVERYLTEGAGQCRRSRSCGAASAEQCRIHLHDARSDRRGLIDPAREFPVDGAAGEGFTNTGNSLVMSPSLVTKYLDAAKEVAEHVVLLPDGVRFSPHTTPARLDRRHVGRDPRLLPPRHGDAQRRQGQFAGHRFRHQRRRPLAARQVFRRHARRRRGVDVRQQIDRGGGQRARTQRQVPGHTVDGACNGANPRCCWTICEHAGDGQAAEAERWRSNVAVWQKRLWGFRTVGHIGKVNGPKSWMQPVTPLVARQELKLKLPEGRGEPVTVSLVVTDVGDGSDADFAIVENLRLVAPGRPDVILRDVSALYRNLAARRAKAFRRRGGLAESG